MQEYKELSLTRQCLSKKDMLEKIATSPTRIRETFLYGYNIDNCKCPSCSCGSSVIDATINVSISISIAVGTAPM